MTISEMIAELQELMNDYGGDMQVVHVVDDEMNKIVVPQIYAIESGDSNTVAAIGIFPTWTEVDIEVEED